MIKKKFIQSFWTDWFQFEVNTAENYISFEGRYGTGYQLTAYWELLPFQPKIFPFPNDLLVSILFFLIPFAICTGEDTQGVKKPNLKFYLDILISYKDIRVSILAIFLTVYYFTFTGWQFLYSAESRL